MWKIIDIKSIVPVAYLYRAVVHILVYGGGTVSLEIKVISINCLLYILTAI